MIIINRIYFVRHGESEANATKIFTHEPEANYNLTEKGIEQAKYTSEFFKNIKIDSVYSSQLLRAYRTATFIVKPKNLSILKNEKFNELNLGLLEGKPIEDKYLESYNTVINNWKKGNIEMPFEGGENLITLADRMRNGIMDIIDLSVEKTILVVAHGGIISGALPVICDNVNHLDFYSEHGNHVDNCSITICEINKTAKKIQIDLIDWNNTSHLLQPV